MRPDPARGVFETMLVRDGRVHATQRHLDRLAHSVGALYARRLPADIAAQLQAHASRLTGEHRLRVDVVPGDSVAVTTQSVAARYRRPVTLAPLVVPGGLGPHKWRDRRLLDVASRSRGTTSGHEVAPLLIDADDTVLEAAWGNLWLLEDDALITPPADGRILPGVTRALLLELAPSLGLRPREEPISLHRARRAPVTFATSAIRLAVPVTLSGHAASAMPAVVDRLRTALAPHS
jgi:para-aminobenzoate synthetase / 4-amino-4-deoxychorismate lyase